MRHEDRAVAGEAILDEVRGGVLREGAQIHQLPLQITDLTSQLTDGLELALGAFAQLPEERRLAERRPREEPETEREEHGDDGDDVVAEGDHDIPRRPKIQSRACSSSCRA